MAAQDTATTETNDNSLSPEADLASFKGFATKDGEVIAPKADKTADKPVKTAPAADKVAARADSSDDDDDSGADQRHKSAQDRINKAVGRQRAAERERDRLAAENATTKARIDALEARLNGGSQQQQTQQRAKVDPNAPNPADYEYGEADIKFIRDLTAYEVRKELAADKETQSKSQQTQEQARQQAALIKARDKFLAAGETKYGADFEDLVTIDELKISPTLAQLLLDSDVGVDIAYELASDPDEAKKVSAMAPHRQAAWFGRKETEFSSESSDADEEDDNPSVVKTTKAPKPPTLKNRGGGSSQPISAATNDFAAFERMASKQK